MAQQQKPSGLLQGIDTVNDISSLLSSGQKVMDAAKYMGFGVPKASTTAGFGATAPGIMDTGAGFGAAGMPSALAATPFLALAGFNLSKILGSILSDKPKIGFSGTDPKFSYGNGRYYGKQKDRQPNKKLEPSSKKYNYHISVEDTGRDGEIGAALVKEFDRIFDGLAAQGVPVNQLLNKNRAFAFGGRLDKSTTPQSLIQDVFTHMGPDIEAYQNGQTPPERTIRVEPVGTVKGMPGRAAAEAGVTNDPYNVVIGDGGAVLEDTNIVLKPGDPRTARLLDANGKIRGRDRENLPQGVSLSPGFTYTLDTSGMSGRELAEMEKYQGLRSYTAPGENPAIPVKSTANAAPKQQGTPEKDMDGYTYDKDKPQAFEDYVNTFYDKALAEYQKQQGQYKKATDKYEAGASDALATQQGVLEELRTRLDSGASQYKDTQDRNSQMLENTLDALLSGTRQEQERFLSRLDNDQKQMLSDYAAQKGQYLEGLESRQNELFDTARQEQAGMLDRLTRAVDAKDSSNLPRVTRLAGGQEMSYIPKSLRQASEADRTAEMGLFDRGKASSDTFLNTGTQQAQNLYGNQSNFADSLLNARGETAQGLYDRSADMSNNMLKEGTGAAEKIHDTRSDTAGKLLDENRLAAAGIAEMGDKAVTDRLNTGENVYRNEMALASVNPTLTYLDALKKLVEEERSRQSLDRGNSLDLERLKTNQSQFAQQQEANEPGILDYIKGIGTAGEGLSALGPMVSKGWDALKNIKWPF